MATSGTKELIRNRKARHDFHVLETYETGIALVGTEVKSCRAHNISMADAYARVEGNELWMYNVHIEEFVHGNRFNHDPRRRRKLLVHRSELRKIKQQLDAKGLTAVPLSLYLKRGKVKVQLGICRGKSKGDKRETVKKREAQIEMRKAMKNR